MADPQADAPHADAPHADAPHADAPRAEVSLSQRVDDAIALMEALVADRAQLNGLSREQRKRLLMNAGHLAHPSRDDIRAKQKTQRLKKKRAQRDADEAVLESTRIRQKRAAPVFATPSAEAPRELELQGDGGEGEAPELNVPRSCYICKERFTRVHSYYDSMCEPCGDFNFAKRTQTADLRGRAALLTGGRVKIGYHTGIKLLRAGCRLIVTTRFPNDAARRYAQEEDASDWLHRLVIYGLDLRNTPQVEAFCRQLLATEPRLDFIVSNACQTVRRPPGFYAHLMEAERQPAQLSEAARSVLGKVAAEQPPAEAAALLPVAGAPSAEASQIALLPDDLAPLTLFPEGQLDADEQQVDLRETNSWRLLAHEVPAVELLEVQLVNAVAPFLLAARLKPLMLATPERDKHVVNVSAVEGQFYRTFKTPRHPHTNMAKAALNMMTRTVAPDFVRDGVHVNSVDTGWVTDEDPDAIAKMKREEHRFHPPLDIVDGAARILAPIFDGFITGEHVWGRFLKDYVPTDW